MALLPRHQAGEVWASPGQLCHGCDLRRRTPVTAICWPGEPALHKCMITFTDESMPKHTHLFTLDTTIKGLLRGLLHSSDTSASWPNCLKPLAQATVLVTVVVVRPSSRTKQLGVGTG